MSQTLSLLTNLVEITEHNRETLAQVELGTGRTVVEALLDLFCELTAEDTPIDSAQEEVVVMKREENKKQKSKRRM